MVRPLFLFAAAIGALQSGQTWRPVFELVQPELFSATGGQANAWADPDNDGDLDYFVGFRGRPNRFYRNDNGRFRDVASDVGLADDIETRTAAWGDFDADGDADLYVGFADATIATKLYRNDAGGTRFVDVASDVGVALKGVSRQTSWIDYDGDGDLDLFAAFRDRSNQILSNDEGRFVDVSASSGIDDARKSVSAVWWDFDRDGDLDLFVANQEGEANGLYRQRQGRFEDVAGALQVTGMPRAKEDGGVGPSLADFDLDGDFDLFVANYGPSALYRNDGTVFVDVARPTGIDLTGHGVTSAWGDLDNDGLSELYVANFIAGQPRYRDALFHNSGAGTSRQFTDVLPELLETHDATHGVQFVDFTGDGQLDLALTNNDPKGGGHALLQNRSVARGRGFVVDVTDASGRRTKAGSEVRVYQAGTRRLLSAALVDTGSGYCSQNAIPVFVSVPAIWAGPVDVEVTTVARGQRPVTASRDVDPLLYRQRPLRLRVP